MAITITINDVKEVCQTSLSDSVIQRTINMVQARIGDCVESSYDTDTGEMILISAVCHFIEIMNGGELNSETAPNGAKLDYANHASGEGLKSTKSGRMLLSLDTAGCYNALVEQTFLFLAAGNPAEPC